MVDDYDEARAAEECAAEGAQPGSVVADRQFQSRPIDGIAASAIYETTARRDRSEITQFAGVGRNPWTATSGEDLGNKRAKLVDEGFSETNWMQKLAVDARDADRELRRDRESRMMRFEDSGVSSYPHLYRVAKSARPSSQEDVKPETQVATAQSTSTMSATEEPRAYQPAARARSHPNVEKADIVVEDRATTLSGLKRPWSQVEKSVNVVRGVYEVSFARRLQLSTRPDSSPRSPSPICRMSRSPLSQRTRQCSASIRCLTFAPGTPTKSHSRTCRAPSGQLALALARTPSLS